VLIPPILEVFVLWHPDDTAGASVAGTILEHFHGTAFSGLVGGAVEVYTRSAGWHSPGSPPRPLPFIDPLPNGLATAAVTVVVPVLGIHLARAAEDDEQWRSYVRGVVAGAEASPDVVVFGLQVDDGVLSPGGELASIFANKQLLAREGATNGAVLCRDLAHSIAGFVDGTPGQPLRVFISHTKRNSPEEEPDRVLGLVALVREVIGLTHLRPFFDAADLQPGVPWEDELTRAAASSALLIVRTDVYASRDWCQREVLAAKRADMPVVALQALCDGEERGSFLMDHVPSVACDRTNLDDQRSAIEMALNKLVDEALKRSLWAHQRERLSSFGFDWLPSNAPEPTTLAAWLRSTSKRPAPDDRLFVLHPDPPLGHAEVDAIDDVLEIAGLANLVEILTPRTFANRGGQVRP
jgi:hypothetical protein